MSLAPGLTLTLEAVAEPRESAAAMASGALEVFSTPSLVARFEAACLQAVQPHLSEGSTTVGVEVAVKHLKATPIGQPVRCTVTVTAVDGRRIAFSGELWDAAGKIGEGTHTRVVVEAAAFLARLG